MLGDDVLTEMDQANLALTDAKRSRRMLWTTSGVLLMVGSAFYFAALTLMDKDTAVGMLLFLGTLPVLAAMGFGYSAIYANQDVDRLRLVKRRLKEKEDDKRNRALGIDTYSMEEWKL